MKRKTSKKARKEEVKSFGMFTTMGAKMEMPVNEDWKGWVKRVCICVPTTGLVRMEWVMGRFGQIIPVNWSNHDIFQFYSMYSPLGHSVADARNLCVQHAVTQNFEWTFFNDHDTILPQGAYLKLVNYMNLVRRDPYTQKEDRSRAIPIVGGLYYCKGSQPEPLIFRGRGNSFYQEGKGTWKRGDKVWVDGLPMGCTLIHTSILRVVWEASEQYSIPTMAGPQVVRRVFDTPRLAWNDPESGKYNQKVGTEDLFFFDRLVAEKVYDKAGWPKYQKKKYPLLCDTSIFCQHISEGGERYPANVGII
jgi:hypothetical protein